MPTDEEITEKGIEAAASLGAAVIVSGLIGLVLWCFGETPKIALGISIIAFFLALWVEADAG